MDGWLCMAFIEFETDFGLGGRYGVRYPDHLLGVVGVFTSCEAAHEYAVSVGLPDAEILHARKGRKPDA